MIITDIEVNDNEYNLRDGTSLNDTYLGGYYYNGSDYVYTHFLINDLFDNKYKTGKFVKIHVFKNSACLAKNKVYSEPKDLSEEVLVGLKDKVSLLS